jgi:hypothetical protein
MFTNSGTHIFSFLRMQLPDLSAIHSAILFVQNKLLPFAAKTMKQSW